MKNIFNKFSLLILVATASTIGAATLIPASNSNAAILDAFNPENIIDDSVFTDNKSMSAADIQNFLNSKNSVCLKNLQVLGLYDDNRDGLGDEPYGKGKNIKVSAATLIKQAADLYDISPKVILVTLQKEQGLITRTDCPQWRYNTALGYGCPDSAPCDDSAYGFTRQIDYGVWHFKGFFNDTYPVPPTVPGNKFIAYNPNGSCGGKTINIQNRATAALYSYTPYQPNKAALAAGLGEAACGAYGNRNFFYYFTSWFGSTAGTPFFQLPGSPKTYMIGTDDSYYSVENYNTLLDYGFMTSYGGRTTKMPSNYLEGKTNKGNLPLIARYEGLGIFLASNGKLHPFPSENILYSYGFDFGQEATLQKSVGEKLPYGSPLWNVAETAGGGTTYVIDGGEKKPICNWEAFTKLGSPVYSSQSRVSLQPRTLNTLPNGAPVAMEGDIIESWGSGQYGVWQNGTYVPIDSSIAKSTGAINCGVPADSANKLPKSTVKIENLVSGDGSQYIINGSQKLKVNSADSTLVSISAEKFIPTTSALLNKLVTKPLANLVSPANSLGVYVMRDGKAHGIPSEADLYGLGYNFNQVQSITPKTFSSIPKNGLIYRPGQLVRESGTLGVYMLDDSFGKHPFTSESALYNYGYKWSNVRVISAGSLSAYSESTPIVPYIKEHDTLYWLMDNGVKHKIPTSLITPQLYNITGSNSIALPASVLSRFPMKSTPLTKVFRAKNGIGVYLIQDGKKRVFASEKILLNSGYTWSDVRVLSPQYVSSIPEGQPIF